MRCLTGLSAVVLAVLCAGCGREPVREPGTVPPGDYKRIVSLAPSITEILFALGLGDRVVGVTRYCTYPPEAQKRQKVGGHLDPNYEAILALDPDLIVMLVEHDRVREHFARLGRRTLTVRHRTLAGVLDSIETIGRATRSAARAAALAARMRGELHAVEERTARMGRPRVLVCVGRRLGIGRIEDVDIAGRDGFYDEMLRIAGGTNAYDGNLPYPKVSMEGILAMAPDVVIDLAPQLREKKITKEEAARDWNVLGSLPAVRNGRVHVLIQDFAVRPGPRSVMTVRTFAGILHPELESER